MSILVDRETRLIVQGITGRDGSFHTKAMLAYGSRVVGGVTPGKGGQRVDGIPVFDTVAEAVRETGATCSVCFVPARFCDAAIDEVLASEIPLFVCITEGIPTSTMLRARRRLRGSGKRMIGPNCPGLVSPPECKAGIIPARILSPGGVGVISRSGTLTYEVVQGLSAAGLGQSTCVGIGGDPVIGSGFVDILELFEKDPRTSAVVLIGEIGGDEEERAAAMIRARFSKPVVAFISGRTAPPGKRMGHAGAIVAGGSGGADAKVRALEEAGVRVADRPDEIPSLLIERGVGRP